jgi:hypothetical protein
VVAAFPACTQGECEPHYTSILTNEYNAVTGFTRNRVEGACFDETALAAIEQTKRLQQ